MIDEIDGDWLIDWLHCSAHLGPKGVRVNAIAPGGFAGDTTSPNGGPCMHIPVHLLPCETSTADGTAALHILIEGVRSLLSRQDCLPGRHSAICISRLRSEAGHIHKYINIDWLVF